MKIRTLLLMVGFLFMWGYSPDVFGASTLSIVAKVSAQKVPLNGSFTFEVSVSGEDIGNVPAPSLDAVTPYFTVISTSQSTSVSFVNGAMSSTKRLRYTLRPKKLGAQKIPSVALSFKGRRYRTDPIPIEVIAAAKPSAPPPQTSRSRRGSASFSNLFQDSFFQRRSSQLNVFAKASFSKARVFVGEQVFFSVDLYIQSSVGGNVNMGDLDLDGFKVEDLTNREPRRETVNGQSFMVHRVLSKLLFPYVSGVREIPAIQIGLQLGAFSPSRVIETDPVSVDVRDLPVAGRPAHFSGAVGGYRLKRHEVVASVNQNVPVTVKMTLYGEGNIKDVTDLVAPEDANLKIYKAGTKDAIQLEEGMSGRRDFEYIVVPKLPGIVSVSPFQLSYYSLRHQGYLTLKTAPFELVVSPEETLLTETNGSDKETLVLLRQDIHYIKQHYSLGARYRLLQPFGWFGVLFLVNGLFLGGFLYRGVKAIFFKVNDTDLQRKRAAEVALLKIDQFDSEKAAFLMSDLYNVVIEFLKHKTGVSFLGLGDQDIRAKLKKRGLDDGQIRSIVTLLGQLSFASYAPEGAVQSEKKVLLQAASGLFRQLKSWKGE